MVRQLHDQITCPTNTTLDKVLDTPDGHRIRTCIQCGTCSGACPYGQYMEYGPRRIVAKILNGEIEEVFQSASMLKCVGCYACVGFCPRLAMFTHPDLTEPFKCVACGKCADECPEGVLSMVEVPDLEPSETARWAIKDKEVVA